MVENLSATLSGTGEVAAIEQHDHLSKENRRNITDIPTGVNLNKATGSNFWFFSILFFLVIYFFYPHIV